MPSSTAAFVLTVAMSIVSSLAGQTAPVPSGSTTSGAPSGVSRADTALIHGLLRRMPTETQLRFSLAGRTRLSGRYKGMLGDTVVLRTRLGENRVPANRIDSVWTRHWSTVPNTIHGALLGELVAATLALGRTLRVSCHNTTLASRSFPFPGCSARAGGVASAAGVGVIVGGLAGATVGVAFPRWRLRVP